MRPLYFILSLVMLFTMPGLAFSSSSSSSGGSNPSGAIQFLDNATNMDELVNAIKEGDFDINTITNGAPVYSTILPGSAGALACDFRRQLSCGNMPLIIITVSVFTVGMLTLMRKMRPFYAMMIVGAALILVNADQVVGIVMGDWLGWMATKTCWCTNFSL